MRVIFPRVQLRTIHVPRLKSQNKFFFKFSVTETYSKAIMTHIKNSLNS